MNIAAFMIELGAFIFGVCLETGLSILSIPVEKAGPLVLFQIGPIGHLLRLWLPDNVS